VPLTKEPLAEPLDQFAMAIEKIRQAAVSSG